MDLLNQRNTYAVNVLVCAGVFVYVCVCALACSLHPNSASSALIEYSTVVSDIRSIFNRQTHVSECACWPRRARAYQRRGNDRRRD